MASPSEIAALEIRITGVEKALSQFSNFQQTTTKTMSSSEAAVARSLKNMAAQFIGVAAAARAVKSVISSGVGFNQFVENTTTSFTVMMKSAEKAKAQMKDLYDFAVNSPLTFKESAASSKQLMAYGFAAEELVPTMRTLGSVAIATGHSLDDISYVYGTLKSQGRAYSRDLMQFGMRGIPIYEELAKVMGVDVKQIQKMASEGKIGFKEVEQAFENMTTGSGRFSGIIEGYMTTLTGKLSMLGDIAQQSAGSLMSGVTDGLKDFVDSMTKALSSEGAQSFIDDMSGVLGGLAAVLGSIITALAAILPVIGKIMKALIPAAVVLGFLKLIAALPVILTAIGATATASGVALAKFSFSLVTTAAAETAVATGATAAAAGIGVLSESLKMLALANPWLTALVIIAAAGGAIITVLHKVEKEARTSTNEDVRAQELARKYKPIHASGMTQSAFVNAEDVAGIAEQYKLSEGATANILKNIGALSAEAWQQYLNTKSANMALQEQDKIAKGLKHTSTTIEQDQMAFLSGLTGKNASIYEDLSNVDLNALGNKGAKDYIAGFAQARQNEKDIFGFAYTEDQLKASLEAEAKGITDALVAGSKVNGLFDTYYNETLISRLYDVNQELDGMGKKGKKLKEMGTWWAPIIKAASLTVSALDDIDVATAQAQEGATKEYEQRLESYRATLKDLSGQQERAAVIAEINELTATYLQYQKDITKEAAKRKSVSQFNTALGGNEAYWSNRQADQGNRLSAASDSSAVAGYKLSVGDIAGAIGTALRSISISLPAAASAGVDQLTKGTEVGNVASSEMGLPSVLMQAGGAFANMLGSIENVGKVLNPLTTLMEGVKSIIEPLLNNALKPIVQILTQVGKVIGKALTPFIGLIKIVTTLVYAVLTPLMAVLQIVSNGFSWLYDNGIVPFGNAVIAVANGFIGLLNTAFGWLGVDIEYIDALETTTEAMKDLSSVIDNMKSSLDQTIDYLTDKINDAVDKQLNSLKDLYEVGAITASGYENQAKALTAQKIDSNYVLVSAMDKAIASTGDMYKRLAELYNLKDVIENAKGLTESQQVKLLKEAGLSDVNMESAMHSAVLQALKDYQAATTGDKGTAGNNTIDTSNLDYGVTERSTKALKSLNEQATKDILYMMVHGTDATSITATTAKIKEIQDAVSSTSKLTEAEKGAILAKYGFATGTSNVPYDMVARIHQGEGIIPATFMDSIRSGELALSSGGNDGSGQAVNVYVNVEGSVQTENDLADAIAENMYIRRRRGLLTV